MSPELLIRSRLNSLLGLVFNNGIGKRTHLNRQLVLRWLLETIMELQWLVRRHFLRSREHDILVYLADLFVLFRLENLTGLIFLKLKGGTRLGLSLAKMVDIPLLVKRRV